MSTKKKRPGKWTNSCGVQPRAAGLVDFAKRAQQTVKAACSCGGENENCYRCSGTGVYDKVIAPGAIVNSERPSAYPDKLATFSSDSRGGTYGIREQGRFMSDPEHDNFDDESSA